MIASALITECRQSYGDVPKSTQVSRAADGTATLFNLGRFPVVEGSYSIYFGGVAKTETTDFTIDKDNGDLKTISTLSANTIVRSNHKYANFRDTQWVQAINHGIDRLNAMGFFRQVVRNTAVMHISANVRVYSGPTACVDIYELLESSDLTVSGAAKKLPYNWSYQQDANKVVLGSIPSRANVLFVSYMRNMKMYGATSATLDILDDWKDMLKKAAGSYYFRYMAAKIATQGAATIDEGHFSFTNTRTMANDLNAEFESEALRKKPTRPAKDVQYHVDQGGNA